MTSQPDQQAVKINILTNISRSKENQAMQFGQLTEYHMRNIFLEESYTNELEKLFPDPFLRDQN